MDYVMCSITRYSKYRTFSFPFLWYSLQSTQGPWQPVVTKTALPKAGNWQYQNQSKWLPFVDVQNPVAHNAVTPQFGLSSDQVLRDLYWLPIKQHNDFKIAALTYKVLSTTMNQSTYLCQLISIYEPTHSLCSQSQDKRVLIKPHVNTSTGKYTFAFSSRQIWNSIPLEICSKPAINSFHSNHILKHFISSLLLSSNFTVPVLPIWWPPVPLILQVEGNTTKWWRQ